MSNEITDISTYQEDIELGETLKRLQENKDYQKLIKELFLDGGSINLTKNFVVVRDKEEIVEQIKARSYLYRFLIDIENNAYASIEALKELQEEGE